MKALFVGFVVQLLKTPDMGKSIVGEIVGNMLIMKSISVNQKIFMVIVLTVIKSFIVGLIIKYIAAKNVWVM